MQEKTKASESVRSRLKPISFDRSMANFFGNWIWRAVHALLDHQDFDSSPTWMAQRLNISVDEAFEALQGLVLLGLAKNRLEGFEVARGTFVIPDEHDQLDGKIRNHSMVAQQILNLLTPERRVAFQNTVAASNKETFTKFFRQIESLMVEFMNVSSCLREKDGVYFLSFEGVDAQAPDSSKARPFLKQH